MITKVYHSRRHKRGRRGFALFMFLFADSNPLLHLGRDRFDRQWNWGRDGVNKALEETALPCIASLYKHLEDRMSLLVGNVGTYLFAEKTRYFPGLFASKH